MHADAEQWPPPNDPVAFESLCLDLYREIWGKESGAQKNGRSGQPQAGVDVYGQDDGRWVGVQCKQKDGLLWREVTVAELEAEVRKALSFQPPLDLFILATTGPADGKVQKQARLFSEEHREKGLFRVEVQAWPQLWHELHGRRELLARIGPKYWPSLFGHSPQRIEASRLTHSAPKLFGRDAEMARLEAAWADPATHVLTLVAWGGVGKTSLVAEWQGRLAARGFDGADYFDWSFYSQGTREQGGASSDTFIAAALRFFGDPELASGPTGPWEKGAALAKLVAERRALLVLDGLEPLQYPPSSPMAGELKDPGVKALLKSLAAKNPGLCVVTTRESVADLERFRGTTAPEVELERLSREAGVELLRSLGVLGRESEYEALVEDVDGHALTLNLLGTYLAKAHGGDIRRRDRVDLQKADAKVQVGHAFKAMAAYERWLAEGGEEGARQLAVLRLLGLFDRPADAGCLNALRQEPAIPGLTEPLMELAEEDWNWTCSALEGCKLLSRRDERTIDAHPLLREYFATQLREKNPEAWKVAHGRLFDHLKDTTEHQPDTLEGLQPLYQAVAHGCWAERQQEARNEVYWSRISRGRKDYVVKKLGAFGTDLGAVACFFEAPWSRVSPALTEPAQAWLLNQAAFRLRALGRLGEALEPMRAGVIGAERQEDWRNAALGASNLSELELTLGELAAAERDAREAVAFADRSEDTFHRTGMRTTLADALHQAGRREEALALFREAEALQATWQPEYSRLYSLQGFRFCDLLLAAAERAAWRGWLVHSHAECGSENWGNEERRGEELGACREVEEGAEQTLAWVTAAGLGLLNLALDQLTQARASLYAALLAGAPSPYPASNLHQAVDALRRAGTTHHVPKGLLTRALILAANGDESAARADLDEAWEIAERGPMPLFQADIHLHRARLFKDKASLAEARRLIEKHGYWRRKEELEDAEEAAKGW